VTVPAPAPTGRQPWESWIADSYADLFARPLARRSDLYDSDRAVLCHGLGSDPTFVYVNRTAQQLWERPWRSFIGMPSRLTAPPAHRAERSAALNGGKVATDYTGERVSATGRRFRILGATIFPVRDGAGEVVGQAATFVHWEPIRRRPLLEVLATSVDEVGVALSGGADRIELCADYASGGLTPSTDLVHSVAGPAREQGVGVMAMIRPRPGDFVYSRHELDTMRRSVADVLAAGASGVVLGCLTAGGQLDVVATGALVQAAAGAPVTVHRAVDDSVDPLAAALAAFATGADRVLTSGGAATALLGSDVVRRMVAETPIAATVVAGSGVTPDNVAALVARTGVTEVHGSLRTAAGPPDPAAVQAMVAALAAIGQSG